MSLTTYAELQTAIASELHRDGLTSYIPDFITRAESRINSKLRIRQMETTQASTMAAGVIAVPTNYIELKDAYISSTAPYAKLERKSADWIYDKYPYRTSDGIPKFMAREASNFIFGPFPDSDYVVTLVYYNRLAPLSMAVNSVFTSYPGLWLYGALLEAEGFLKNDKRIALWGSRFEELFKLVQMESDDEDFSGSVLTVVAG
jgi:hypothetical protein